jgi:hypothetical protein
VKTKQQHTYERENEMPSIVLPADKEKASIEPLTEGKYNFEITKVTFGQSQNGTDYMELDLREVNDGRHLWPKLYFSSAAGWKIKSLLKATGCDIAAGEAVDINDEYAVQNLIGKKVGADVDVEEYNDKQRNVVKRFTAAEPF